MCTRFLMQFSRIVVKSSKMLLEILVENQNDVAVSFFFSFFVFSASEIKFELKLVNYGKLNSCTYMFFFIKRSPHPK